jgi:hypothetical protein
MTTDRHIPDLDHTTLVEHVPSYPAQPEGHGMAPLSEYFPDDYVCHACSDAGDEWIGCRLATWTDPIAELRRLTGVDRSEMSIEYLHSWAADIVAAVDRIRVIKEDET